MSSTTQGIQAFHSDMDIGPWFKNQPESSPTQERIYSVAMMLPFPVGDTKQWVFAADALSFGVVKTQQLGTLDVSTVKWSPMSTLLADDMADAVRIGKKQAIGILILEPLGRMVTLYVDHASNSVDCVGNHWDHTPESEVVLRESLGMGWDVLVVGLRHGQMWAKELKDSKVNA
jgi:hypothetical protein